MRHSIILLLLAASLLLAACQGAAAPATAPATQEPVPPTAAPQPSATQPVALAATPQAGETPQAYPAPTGEPGAAVGGEPWVAYPPVPGDESLTRGKFFVDTLTLLESAATPGGFDLYVEGSLPDPCHQPRAVINPPDAEKRINVELYSVASPEVACVQVIQEWTGQIATLSGYPSGTYTLFFEGKQYGEFTVP